MLSARKLTNNLRRWDETLHAAAIAKAKAANDPWNETLIGAINVAKMSPADRDLTLAYLGEDEAQRLLDAFNAAIVPTKAAAEPRERRAKVHLHVPTGRYSISYSGERVSYVDAVLMRDVEFIVDQRLRAKFEAYPNRRTVHALVKGVIISTTPPSQIGGERVRCNPFLYRGFVRAADEVRAVRAEQLLLLPGGRMEAIGLEVDATTDVRCQLTRAS